MKVEASNLNLFIYLESISSLALRVLMNGLGGKPPDSKDFLAIHSPTPYNDPNGNPNL